MFIGTSFKYDNEVSDSYGVLLVRVDSNNKFVEQSFGLNRSIETITINNANHITNITQSPIKFKVQITKQENGKWTLEDRMKITRWLFKNNYCDFESEDSPLVYKCIAVGEPRFYNNTYDCGYAEIEFVCNSNHAYTKPYLFTFYNDKPEPIIDIIDGGFFTDSAIERMFDGRLFIDPMVEKIKDGGTFYFKIKVDLESLGNLNEYYYPEITIQLLQNETKVKLIDLHNKRTISLSNLMPNETIYMNGQNDFIRGEKELYLLEKLEGKKFLRLDYGLNEIKVIGTCKIEFKCQFPVMI